MCCWYYRFYTHLTISASFFSGLPVDWQGEPHIAINPKPQAVQPGAKLSLRCAAFGIPIPYYQWYRNGQPLLDKTSDTLEVRQHSRNLFGLHSRFSVKPYYVNQLIWESRLIFDKNCDLCLRKWRKSFCFDNLADWRRNIRTWGILFVFSIQRLGREMDGGGRCRYW